MTETLQEKDLIMAMTEISAKKNWPMSKTLQEKQLMKTWSTVSDPLSLENK